MRACHPEPTVAVTGLCTLLAVAAGLAPGVVALVCAAVLTGQLSIGWSNDVLDARRDRVSARADKPVATGLLPARTVITAIAVALAACVPLSLATGVRAGAVHLVAVAGGWAYNLGLKRTPLSFLPYGVTFGLLPAFVVLAGGGQPPWWLYAAGSLLGVGAHMFNVLPDLDDDRATGVRGLPVLLGAAATRTLGCLLLVAAALVLVLGPADTVGPWTWIGLSVAVGLAVTAALLDRDRRSRRPFLLALAVAAVDLALLAGRTAALA